MGEMPPALALVESFLNSVDVESGSDDLGTLAKYGSWLRKHEHSDAGLDAAGLEQARALRDALRAAAQAHHDQVSTDTELLDELAGQIQLRARFGATGVRLDSAEQGARRVLGEVLAAVVLAAGDGTWSRLKLCREDSCQWVFYDQSKNSSKQWCSMSVCGNRNKTRAYRSRQRT